MDHGQHAHHGHSHPGQAAPSLRASRLAASATLHCLLGCAAGELAGLVIGALLGLGPWERTALATVLGFVAGYLVGLWPLVRRGTGWAAAFRTLWLGETISIAVMELAMNVTDWHVGGMTTGLDSPRFWLAYLAAVPVGFLAAWPVNAWPRAASRPSTCTEPTSLTHSLRSFPAPYSLRSPASAPPNSPIHFTTLSWMSDMWVPLIER
jgi:hypothetical protein